MMQKDALLLHPGPTDLKTFVKFQSISIDGTSFRIYDFDVSVIEAHLNSMMERLDMFGSPAFPIEPN